jgi:transposase InsO family protein
VTARYAFIAAEKADHDRLVADGRAHRSLVLPLTRMCAALEVSRSGFYDWVDRADSARARRRAVVARHVRAAFELGRGAYGARRVHAILGRSDDPAVASASLKLVRSVMREHGLVACQPRAYRTTTVPDGGGTTIRDHLGRDFTADAPGQKLVGDITYIKTWQGWLYLATVIDCHTRMVVGWSMAEHMRTDLIKAAMTMAARRIQLPAGAIFHSDRGSQYTSSDYAKHLADLTVTASMGRTGVCWDNALAESFFGALKNELVHRYIFPTRKKARRAIAEYIEVFYNRVRIHSTLGYKTPHEVLTEHHRNASNAA